MPKENLSLRTVAQKVCMTVAENICIALRLVPYNKFILKANIVLLIYFLYFFNICQGFKGLFQGCSTVMGEAAQLSTLFAEKSMWWFRNSGEFASYIISHLCLIDDRWCLSICKKMSVNECFNYASGFIHLSCICMHPVTLLTTTKSYLYPLHYSICFIGLQLSDIPYYFTSHCAHSKIPQLCYPKW